MFGTAVGDCCLRHPCPLCTHGHLTVQDENCTHWSYGPGNRCELKAAAGSRETTPGVVSGLSGPAIPSSHALWTSNPQNFKNNGYLTLSTGKIFHTEEGVLPRLAPRTGSFTWTSADLVCVPGPR